MKLITRILLLAALATPGISSAETETPLYDDWYQVEIIVFALRNTQPTDESWPLREAKYPGDMVSVSPIDAASIRPNNLDQLRILLANPTPGIDGESGGAAEPASSFLFENRSRASRARLLDRLPGPAETGAVPGSEDGTEIAAPGSDEEFVSNTSDIDLDEIMTEALPKAFRELPGDQRVLASIAGSINRSSRYRLLLHTAWLQPARSGGGSWPVLIEAGNRYDDTFEVDGTLTVSRSRFLHVDANLWFTEFTRKFEQGPVSPLATGLSAEMQRRYPDLVEAERDRGQFIAVRSHPMRLSRRMRSSTLHYLDNPFFGVFIQIEAFSYDPAE